ncbi:hypothetical protein LguiB_025166 [Lonicera macranthoides]
MRPNAKDDLASTLNNTCFDEANNKDMILNNSLLLLKLVNDMVSLLVKMVLVSSQINILFFLKT